ncbi:putative catabolite repression protein [Alternaria alternata]|nr:putative catabolite repression protein [Alternaria alternata]
MQRTQTGSSVNRLRSNSNLTSGSMLDEEEVVHPVEPRARTAMLPPVLATSGLGTDRKKALGMTTAVRLRAQTEIMLRTRYSDQRKMSSHD